MLYRTNAQSRAVEDGLRQAGIPYAVLGGTGFYERKEIKDALAYLKLVLNPHDDVALRRVINVPPRGIGKGVMEALERVDPRRRGRRRAAAARRADRRRSRQLAVGQARRRGRRAACWRAGRSPRSPRSATMLLEVTAAAAASSRCPRCSACCSTAAATCASCARSAARRPTGAIENLMELVSAAREYEAADPDAGLPGFVDRLALLSDVDKPEGSRAARVLLMTLHSAKGLEFPVVVIAGLEEGLFPHSRARRGRGRARRGTPALLRRHHPGAHASCTSPARRGGGCSASTRAPSRHASSTRSRRSCCSTRSRGPSRLARPPAAGATRPTRTAHQAPARRREPAAEDEDQSGRGGLRAGGKVRHPMFGVGTVVSVEELDDDLKVVVKFGSVGQKTLRAKYAKLELA